MVFDLHTHTLHSDGSLSPAELIQRARQNGVQVLAITDHDTVSGYQHLPHDNAGIRLVTGIELSTSWERIGIHVLGLNIDLQSDAICEAASAQSGARAQRAEKIAEKLHAMGIPDALEGAKQIAPSDYLGRPHFAQHIVQTGKARNLQSAFRKYLAAGKPGDVKNTWAGLDQVIQWIRDAGGIAVLAHPLKYPLTRSKLKRLLDEFINLGGEGMEVVSGQQNPDQIHTLAGLCREKGLLASCGSDFHHPDSPWADLGRVQPLPGGLKPVWDRF